MGSPHPLKNFWLVATLLASMVGCASPGSEINLGPIFSHHTVPNYDHAELAGGIVRRREIHHETTWALSPLWWRRVSPNGDVLTDFLYPLGRHEHRPDRPHTHTWFLPFFWYEREPNIDGVMETDWFALPFIGSSSDDGKESSFALFPFYADLENVLAMDKVNAVMFPFFARTEQSGRKHTWILWPFIGWREGAGSSGFHVWPLYSKAELEGKYSTTWLLWPFISFSQENLDGKYPIQAFHVWPFYGKITQGDYVAQTALWPLFGWASRPSTNYSSWSIWPLIRFEDAPEDGRTFRKFWPLWMHFENRDLEWSSFLWPLIWHRESRVNDEVLKSYWLVPFWRRQTATKQNVLVAEEWQLWPLAHHQLERDGSYHRSFPSLALPPLLDPEAMSRNLGNFYELWAEQGGPDNSWEEKRAIGNLYHEARAEGHRRWSIPVLGGNWSEPDGTSHWSLLGGLLRWSTGPKGEGLEAPAFPGPGWPSLNS